MGKGVPFLKGLLFRQKQKPAIEAVKREPDASPEGPAVPAPNGALPWLDLRPDHAESKAVEEPERVWH